MKLRGAGWLVGSLVTLTALGSIAACDDGESGNGIGITIDAGFNGSETGGGTADGSVPQDSGPKPSDSGSDTGNLEDANLPAQCNDGKVDLGETCDPLDKCPTDCPPQGCNLRTLENGGTCAAACTVVATQTQCQNGDGCCPTDCSIANDNDCGATCGNGVKEAGEKCDGKDCPTDCPPAGCQLRTLMNAGTCQAECVDSANKITQCGAVADGGGASDQCCPATCTSGNDPDCAAGACGNGVFDPPGETCDTNIPQGSQNSCPTSCPAQACNLFKLDKGGTCQAACVANGTISQCINGDGCCATGCNNTNDSDCPAVCGNNVTEPPGETCDGNCPTTCPAQGCQLFTLQGSACTAKCVAGGQQTSCINGDHCCPTGCTSNNDNDCSTAPPKCGNGVLDLGETCDPSAGVNCPICNTNTTCVGTTGSAATCDLKCDQPILKCSSRSLDACCPFADSTGSECNAASDGDCQGGAWKSTALVDPLAFKGDGDCVTLLVTNVEAGGAYDVTTCSEKQIAKGDVVIKSVVGVTSGKFGPIIGTSYGGNDNCPEDKSMLPIRAGYTCQNTDGKPTMACFAPGSGGFFVKANGDLQVTICAQGGSALAPFTVFYNATVAPVIKVP